MFSEILGVFGKSAAQLKTVPSVRTWDNMMTMYEDGYKGMVVIRSKDKSSPLCACKVKQEDIMTTIKIWIREYKDDNLSIGDFYFQEMTEAPCS